MLEEFKKELRALFESNSPFAIDEISPAASVAPTIAPTAIQPTPTPIATPGPTGSPMATPETPMQEDDEKTSDFLYTGPNGDNYKVTVEPDEDELHVFDKDGKLIDIFSGAMLELNGGIPSETRKALYNYWKTEATQPVEEPAP